MQLFSARVGEATAPWHAAMWPVFFCACLIFAHDAAVVRVQGFAFWAVYRPIIVFEVCAHSNFIATRREVVIVAYNSLAELFTSIHFMHISVGALVGVASVCFRATCVFRRFVWTACSIHAELVICVSDVDVVTCASEV
jgi:hypothetical protein